MTQDSANDFPSQNDGEFDLARKKKIARSFEINQGDWDSVTVREETRYTGDEEDMQSGPSTKRYSRYISR